MTERENHDRLETHFHGPVSGSVHTGKGDIYVERLVFRGATHDEVRAIRSLFDSLRAQVRAIAPLAVQGEALKQINALEAEVASEEPDLGAVERVRKWFVEHLPTLAGSVAALLVNPIVGKVVEAAGDLAASELERRFGQHAQQVRVE